MTRYTTVRQREYDDDDNAGVGHTYSQPKRQEWWPYVVTILLIVICFDLLLPHEYLPFEFLIRNRCPNLPSKLLLSDVNMLETPCPPQTSCPKLECPTCSQTALPNTTPECPVCPEKGDCPICPPPTDCYQQQRRPAAISVPVDDCSKCQPLDEEKQCIKYAVISDVHNGVYTVDISSTVENFPLRWKSVSNNVLEKVYYRMGPRYVLIIKGRRYISEAGQISGNYISSYLGEDIAVSVEAKCEAWYDPDAVPESINESEGVHKYINLKNPDANKMLPVKSRMTIKSEGDVYENDIREQNCVQIQQGFYLELNFLKFNLEQGFDILTLEIDGKLIDKYSGSQLPPSQKFVSARKSREICLQFESDDSVAKSGYEAEVRIRHYAVSTASYTECKVVPEKCWSPPDHHCKRGPFWDGRCGFGVYNRTTFCDFPKDTEEEFCAPVPEPLEYCLKDKCEFVDNDLPPEVPGAGPFAYAPLKPLFNGAGRIDLTYPDPFQIIKSKNKDKPDLQDLRSTFQENIQELISRHPTEKLFEYSMADIHNFEQSKKKVGHRLLGSLLHGRLFKVAFTGSSNTAGHDNMFATAYPNQLNAIMRPLWEKIGAEGAGFLSMNRAVGGKLGTKLMGWCVNSLVGDDPDMVFWESFMNDAPLNPRDLEVHLRNAISLPSQPFWFIFDARTGKRTNDTIGHWNRKGVKQFMHDFSDLYPQAALLYYSPFEPLISIEDHPDFFGLGTSPGGKMFGKPTQYHHMNWHPSSRGHRWAAEAIAYFFFSSIIVAIDDLMRGETLIEVEKQPVSDSMFCGEMCNHGPAWCAMTFEPHDPKYGLDRFVVQQDGWVYEDNGDSSVIVFTAMKGGLASIDRKYHLYPPMDRVSTLEIMVKVLHSPGRIMVILGVSSHDSFHGLKLKLDDVDTGCWITDWSDPKYKVIIHNPIVTEPHGMYNNVGCILDNMDISPGKHKLSMTYDPEADEDRKKKDKHGHEVGFPGLTMVVAF